ncbi:ferritin-like domain-containing protein [Ramlibacter rhizophilus]|uniref:Ferritin-like domain-containing protein n=1 Tax=Ramlibacter rhizophilus TaxID=1781167 RepID=A0A4Z0BJZ8_9BURK|nr:ferritin-like domain-containing protein [Ramlibacter rhizophilus]TFY98743.1 ferritin-like domain-containing protein [Ramlibacter rhizophilus]
MTGPPPAELRAGALAVLCAADPQAKRELALELHAAAADLPLAAHAPLPTAPLPGRPQRPALVHPARVPRRSPATSEGLAALLHAIAHIEFNAINLAADAAWRFEGLPRAFHEDWLRVAAEEAFHFTLLREHLRSLGHDYGDFDAHDGLWAMCEKTSGDVLARMALVPRTLEARGLDATPQIQRKLAQVGTPEARRAVEILDVILRDEIGHVAIGNHWYRWLCEREGLDPVAHYPVLVERHAAPRLHPPFNEAARARAGFSAEELAQLLR